jgi:hypothetical protein
MYPRRLMSVVEGQGAEEWLGCQRGYGREGGGRGLGRVELGEALPAGTGGDGDGGSGEGST